MLRTNQTDNTANMSLISNGRAYDQLQTLDISSGPDVNDSDSQTIVVRALLSGQEYVVQATVSHGARGEGQGATPQVIFYIRI